MYQWESVFWKGRPVSLIDHYLEGARCRLRQSDKPA